VPAAVLVVGLMFGTASAYGSVLRISHRTAVAACGYARQHGSRVACSTAPAPAARVRAASSYQNPVSGSAADPSGLNNNGSGTDYYLYTTGNGFPIKHSSDLVTWTNVGNALAHRPSWVVPSGDWHPWAPSVLQVNRSCPNTTSPTCYYMYYVGLSAKFNAHCVALATSTTPAGPFSDRGPLGNGRTDASGRPVGCGDNAGYGNIDPAPFLDTNQNAYLYVSTDNACPAGSASCSSANSTFKPTISVMRLGAKRLAVVGPRYSLFSG